MISFKPKQITKKMIVVLPKRNQDVILQRFGLGDFPKRRTLEAIGKNYNITRERVRQLENFSLDYIRKHDVYSLVKEAAEEMKKRIEERGGIISEEEFLNSLSKDEQTRNHIHFLLVVADEFEKMKESDEFSARWIVDSEKAENVHSILRNLSGQIKQDDIIPENEIIAQMKKHASEFAAKQNLRDEIIRSWLNISKVVDKNALNEWGFASSTNIRPHGMRDYAFLVIRKHGSPMHFKEVSEKITSLFSKRAHPATVHNELIKDKRFVLVGRGLYALNDWGYGSGTVRDVIKNILKSTGPITKEDLINRALKERYVKENTILVNLQNRKYFNRNKDGKYAVART